MVREPDILPGKALLYLLGAPSWTVGSVWFMAPGTACCLRALPSLDPVTSLSRFSVPKERTGHGSCQRQSLDWERPGSWAKIQVCVWEGRTPTKRAREGGL